MQGFAAFIQAHPLKEPVLLHSQHGIIITVGVAPTHAQRTRIQKTYVRIAELAGISLPTNFAGKTYADGSETAKTRKFSPSKVFRYTIIMLKSNI